MLRRSAWNNRLLPNLVLVIITISSPYFISWRAFICHGLSQNPNETLITSPILSKPENFWSLSKASCYCKKHLLFLFLCLRLIMLLSSNWSNIFDFISPKLYHYGKEYLFFWFFNSNSMMLLLSNWSNKLDVILSMLYQSCISYFIYLGGVVSLISEY